MFLVASLALVGIFPFAGFFSKDSIISATLNIGWYGWIFWVVALIGTFLTGVYTFRLYFSVFTSEGDAQPHHEGHGEGPWTMILPVAILSVLAVIGGWIQFAPLWHPLTTWLEPVARTLGVAEPTSTQEWVSSAIALALGLAGIGVAFALYGPRRVRETPRLPALQRTLEHKFYFDELYDALFTRPAAGIALLLRDGLEGPWFIATPTELADDTVTVARGVRRLQTGLLRTYVLFLGTGMAVVGIVFLIVK
jgi:NADH-quinone oxidoreductase subunit L